MDTVLLVSIFLVFVTALVGAFVKRRKRDRVLQDLQGFHTTLRLTDGTLIWGRAEIFPNGIELIYSRPYLNPLGHSITSYVLFKDAYDNVQALYRYHTELTAANQAARIEEVEHTAHPDALRRWGRHLRNFLNTFRDAINESMGMFLSRMKGASTSMLFRTQDEQLKKLGTSVMGAVGSAYDPILERHIGKRVVVELKTGSNDPEEFCGVLKEYSPAWLSLLDCRIAEERVLPISDAARLKLQRDLDFEGRLERGGDAPHESVDLTLRIENMGEEPVRLIRVEAKDYEHRLNKGLACGESHEWTMNALPAHCLAEVDTSKLPVRFTLTCPERDGVPTGNGHSGVDDALPVLPDLALVFESVREVDVYIPRSLGTLRYGNQPTG